jgi:hypothetical protein
MMKFLPEDQLFEGRPSIIGVARQTKLPPFLSIRGSPTPIKMYLQLETLAGIHEVKHREDSMQNDFPPF